MLYLYTLPETQSVFILVKHNYNVVKTDANKINTWIKNTASKIHQNFAVMECLCNFAVALQFCTIIMKAVYI